MRVNPFFMPIIVLVVLLGTVFAAQAAGFWSTSGRDTTDLAQMTPADIKGWMTLQQVMDGLNIPQQELYALASISMSVPPTTALKDLEPLVPGFEVSALRDALTARLGSSANATPAATTAGPTPTTVAPTTVLASSPAATALAQVLPADQIKGKMTLQEVSTQCAVPLVDLLSALKLPVDTDPNALIKDLVAQGTLDEVSTVQQAVVDLQKQ